MSKHWKRNVAISAIVSAMLAVAALDFVIAQDIGNFKLVRLALLPFFLVCVRYGGQWYQLRSPAPTNEEIEERSKQHAEEVAKRPWYLK
jgi:hypothetical protein